MGSGKTLNKGVGKFAQREVGVMHKKYSCEKEIEGRGVEALSDSRGGHENPMVARPSRARQKSWSEGGRKSKRRDFLVARRGV